MRLILINPCAIHGVCENCGFCLLNGARGCVTTGQNFTKFDFVFCNQLMASFPPDERQKELERRRAASQPVGTRTRPARSGRAAATSGGGRGPAVGVRAAAISDGGRPARSKPPAPKRPAAAELSAAYAATTEVTISDSGCSPLPAAPRSNKRRRALRTASVPAGADTASAGARTGTRERTRVVQDTPVTLPGAHPLEGVTPSPVGNSSQGAAGRQGEVELITKESMHALLEQQKLLFEEQVRSLKGTLREQHEHIAQLAAAQSVAATEGVHGGPREEPVLHEQGAHPASPERALPRAGEPMQAPLPLAQEPAWQQPRQEQGIPAPGPTLNLPWPSQSSFPQEPAAYPRTYHHAYPAPDVQAWGVSAPPPAHQLAQAPFMQAAPQTQMWQLQSENFLMRQELLKQQEANFVHTMSTAARSLQSAAVRWGGGAGGAGGPAGALGAPGGAGGAPYPGAFF